MSDHRSAFDQPGQCLLADVIFRKVLHICQFQGFHCPRQQALCLCLIFTPQLFAAETLTLFSISSLLENLLERIPETNLTQKLTAPQLLQFVDVAFRALPRTALQISPIGTPVLAIPNVPLVPAE